MRDPAIVSELMSNAMLATKSMLKVYSKETIRNYDIAKTALDVYLSDTEVVLDSSPYHDMESVHYCCRS